MTESLNQIMSKPTYQASLRLRAGMTVHVTVLSGEEILFDVLDDGGHTVSARLTPAEATEMASLLDVANRAAWRATFRG